MMNLYRNNFEETGAAAVAVDFVMVAETAVAADMRTAAVGNLVDPTHNCERVSSIISSVISAIPRF